MEYISPTIVRQYHVRYDIPTDLSNIFCSEEEILRVLQNLNCTKVTGPDGIISSTVCKPINNLFNLCIRQNSFPPSCKFPNMVPIPKTSSGKSITSNYRPLSLQPIRLEETMWTLVI